MLIQASCERLPISDNSIDLIFTDPPYPGEYLPCYEWLARAAARVLKPGGFVIAMAGNLWLNQIYHMFDESGLSYFYNGFHDSGETGMPVWVNGKASRNCRAFTPIKMFLCYARGLGNLHSGSFISVFRGSQKDKAFHHWGQDVASARYFIDFFSKPGDLVLDPFIGGGTTAVACELIGRRWIGCDLDPMALETTQMRLSGAAIPVQGMFAFT